MGVERDFIMRQLMMLFSLLHKVIALRKKGEKEEAEETIHEIYTALKIEEDLSEFVLEDLLDFLEKQKGLSLEQLEVVALVLREQGELSNSETAKLNFFSKAYFILQKVDLNSVTFSITRQVALQELKEMLPN